MWETTRLPQRRDGKITLILDDAGLSGASFDAVPRAHERAGGDPELALRLGCDLIRVFRVS